MDGFGESKTLPFPSGSLFFYECETEGEQMSKKRSGICLTHQVPGCPRIPAGQTAACAIWFERRVVDYAYLGPTLSTAPKGFNKLILVGMLFLGSGGNFILLSGSIIFLRL